MNKTLSVKIAVLLAFLSLSGAIRGSDKVWLDAKVISIGHISNNGETIPTATIVLFDPGNSNPRAQQQTWVIMLQAAYSKTNVNLRVGTEFKAYRSGETSAIYGFLVIRFLDAKGHEKSELHPILDSL